MRISRIHTDQALTAGTSVRLEGASAHYISNVLRLSERAPLILFNGDGRDFPGRISRCAKRQVEVDLLEELTVTTESPLYTLLGLGISRGDRMDFAIQKCTELGVSEIAPLFTEHGEVKLKGERLEKKVEHWRQVAISACEQSGRGKVPAILQPIPLSAWLDQPLLETRLVFDGRLGGNLGSVDRAGKVALLVGPEGGFSDSELKKAEHAGFTGIQLGPRILRTETAPVAALAVLQCLWGDF